MPSPKLPRLGFESRNYENIAAKLKAERLNVIYENFTMTMKRELIALPFAPASIPTGAELAPPRSARRPVYDPEQDACSAAVSSRRLVSALPRCSRFLTSTGTAGQPRVTLEIHATLATARRSQDSSESAAHYAASGAGRRDW